MRLLLDTHIAIWLAQDATRLHPGELAILGGLDARPTISAVTIWEARLKWHSFHPSGKRKGAIDPVELLTYFRDDGFPLLPLTPGHAAATLHTPLAHKDPFDELLLVQAQEEGLRLLTRDARLIAHPLAISG